ncbi:MAG TPA: hypothetical protein PLR38_10325 [Syntrophorhabdaceae bacterium]|nr:hypothetical protein [Syntrophorhabdaceae bacterium]HOL04922.1 hypothetical protein [Syntrophorhabdaceae bacterium]HPP42894.1 hypothetical protein [Syntrophorhabdaceae bacterium]
MAEEKGSGDNGRVIEIMKDITFYLSFILPLDDRKPLKLSS